MYQHGKRPKTKRNPKIFLQSAVFLGICLVAAALILHNDLTTDSKERTTVPIVTQIEEEKDDTIEVNEPLFSLELPSDWKQTNRVQEQYANFYEWRSTKTGVDNRMLRLHIDIMPASYKVVRMQPLSPSGNKFIVGNLSGNCANFAKDISQQTSGAMPVEAKWEGITFICDPISNNQTIGTGTVEGGIAAELGSHRYFFYYEDLNIRPDDRLFQDILSSFRAK